jgi:hypothetical protein
MVGSRIEGWTGVIEPGTLWAAEAGVVFGEAAWAAGNVPGAFGRGWGVWCG